MQSGWNGLTNVSDDADLDRVDGLDHVEAEVDAAVGVVLPGHGEAGHAVVAVAEQLDPQAVAVLHACRVIVNHPSVPGKKI